MLCYAILYYYKYLSDMGQLQSVHHNCFRAITIMYEFFKYFYFVIISLRVKVSI